MPIPVEKCSFSESLDWKEGGEEIRQYMEERVHLDWAIGEGDNRYSTSIVLIATMMLIASFLKVHMHEVCHIQFKFFFFIRSLIDTVSNTVHPIFSKICFKFA